MAILNIPLNSGAPYQRFSVDLSGRLLTFELRWLNQYSFFAVDISENGTPITQGRGLHPGVNLVNGLLTGLGSIYLVGEPPTIANLGVANKLRYDDGNAV